MSGRRDREARREERLREDEQAGAAERRERLIKIGSAAAFLMVVVVAVLIVVSQSGGGGGDAGNVEGASEVRQLLDGIPQKGMVLGEPSAKVAALEFGDLQCPVCKGYSEEILPRVIENQVRGGEATLEFRNFTILGPQSTPAGAAAIAAGEQVRDIGRWNSERKSKRILGEVAESTAQAERLGFSGTPSFAVEGPGTVGLEALGTPESAGALESAISGAG